MQESRKANQPMLYIEQKEVKDILVHMQGHYFTSQSLNTSEKENKNESPSEVLIERIMDAVRTTEHVPNIKYQIEADEGLYKATKISYEEEKLYFIDASSGGEISLSLHKIKDIQPISL